MSAHSRLSPSSRYRWQLCPASVQVTAQYEKEGAKSSPGAIDGTHSHTLLEYCLKHRGYIADAATFVGMVLSDHEGTFGVEMDRAQRVQIAVEYIRRRQEEHGGTVLSEQRVNPKVLMARDDMSGTVDVQIIGGDVLEVVDYKDGMNPVEAKDNPQMEQYVAGILAGYIERGEAWPFSIVRMTIVQPKVAMKGGNPIDSHDMTIDEFMQKLMPMMVEAAATDDPMAPFVPGEKQCRYCPHQANCTPSSQYALQKAGIKFDAVPSLPQAAAEADPNTTADEQLREIIEAAPLLRKMIEAAEEEALRRITAGHPIAGLKAVRGVGRRAWAQSDEETAAKLTRMGVPKKDVWRSVLVSPAQVEKIKWTNRKGEEKQLTPGQLERMNKEFVTKGEGKMTVVPEADGRKSIDFGNLKAMFEAVPQPNPVPDWLS